MIEQFHISHNAPLPYPTTFKLRKCHILHIYFQIIGTIFIIVTMLAFQDHFKRINGTSPELFESHLAGILWRNQHRSNLMEPYFELIKRAYPLDREPEKDLIPVLLFDSWNMASTHEYQENNSLLRIEHDETWPHDISESRNSVLDTNETPSPQLLISPNTPSVVIHNDTPSPPSQHVSNSPDTRSLLPTKTPTSKRRERHTPPAKKPRHTEKKRLSAITPIRPGVMVAPMDDTISEYHTPPPEPRQKHRPIPSTATSTPQYVTAIIHYDPDSPSTPPPPVLIPQRESITPITTPHIPQKPPTLTQQTAGNETLPDCTTRKRKATNKRCGKKQKLTIRGRRAFDGSDDSDFQ